MFITLKHKKVVSNDAMARLYPNADITGAMAPPLQQFLNEEVNQYQKPNTLSKAKTNSIQYLIR